MHDSTVDNKAQSLNATSHFLSYNPTLNTNYFNDQQTDRQTDGLTDGRTI